MKDDSDSKEESFQEGVVAHIYKTFTVLARPGTVIRGIGFNSIILAITPTSIDHEGTTQRAYKIEALIPVVKVQGKFQDLNFEETIKREFGSPLPEIPDIPES